MSWLLPPNKVTIRPTLWLHHGRAIACPTRRVGTSVPVIAGQDDFLLLFMAFRSSSQVSKDCLMRTSALETDDKNLACSSCARGILSPLHQCKGISRRGLIYKNGRSQRLQKISLYPPTQLGSTLPGFPVSVSRTQSSATYSRFWYGHE